MLVNSSLEITRQLNDFGFKLFSRLAFGNENNVFISPLSVSIVFLMVYNGSGGETQKEMAKALGIDCFEIDEINSFMENYLNSEKSESKSKGVSLEVANSIWSKSETYPKNEFIDLIKRCYNGDFKQISTAEEINRWVSDKTHGMIDKIIEVIDREIGMVLINAIYFKGDWNKEFETNETKEKTFHLENSSEKKVNLMKQFGEFPYFENDDLQMIRLSYGKEEQLCMEITLPRDGFSVDDIIPEINSDKNFYFLSRDGEISIPRFNMEYQTMLNQILSEEMPLAFSDFANFEKMTSSQLKIDQVFHKAIIKVNEKGTEAAAVTALTMRSFCCIGEIPPPPPPFKMICDKPFIFRIYDCWNNLTLFLGVLKNPTE